MSSPTVESSGREAATRRRFTLLDLMALIAVFAACLMVPKTFRALLPAETYQVYDVRQYMHIVAAAWLLSVSVTLAALVVFVPKPAGRDRFRQPGALAMLLVALTWAFDAIQTAIQGGLLLLSTGHEFADGGFWYLFGPIYDASFRAGLAVLAGWTTLALLVQARPEPNWLDRSGRVLGWIWVIWGLFAWFLEYQTFVRHNSALSF